MRHGSDELWNELKPAIGVELFTSDITIVVYCGHRLCGVNIARFVCSETTSVVDKRDAKHEALTMLARASPRPPPSATSHPAPGFIKFYQQL